MTDTSLPAVHVVTFTADKGITNTRDSSAVPVSLESTRHVILTVTLMAKFNSVAADVGGVKVGVDIWFSHYH